MVLIGWVAIFGVIAFNVLYVVLLTEIKNDQRRNAKIIMQHITNVGEAIKEKREIPSVLNVSPPKKKGSVYNPSKDVIREMSGKNAEIFN